MMMLLLGTTFAGKCIIGLSYLIDFMTIRFTGHVVFIQLIVEPLLLILLTIWYQFIDRHYLIIQVIAAIITFITLLYLAFYVPESPKFRYAWRDFDESRELLKDIARRNFCQEQRIQNRFQYAYDSERIELEEAKQELLMADENEDQQ